MLMAFLHLQHESNNKISGLRSCSNSYMWRLTDHVEPTNA